MILFLPGPRDLAGAGGARRYRWAEAKHAQGVFLQIYLPHTLNGEPSSWTCPERATVTLSLDLCHYRVFGVRRSL